jgi:hypothetical protein
VRNRRGFPYTLIHGGFDFLKFAVHAREHFPELFLRVRRDLRAMDPPLDHFSVPPQFHKFPRWPVRIFGGLKTHNYPFASEPYEVPIDGPKA